MFAIVQWSVPQSYTCVPAAITADILIFLNQHHNHHNHNHDHDHHHHHHDGVAVLGTKTILLNHIL
jgi:hypothetical protein